ncbi:MAG TPA: polymer-forming cytoskeletal protein [Burkholderiaceae bacterium]|nr:polymer-forming cytoskeletal protein [Burkholderiaceae bacterium]
MRNLIFLWLLCLARAAVGADPSSSDRVDREAGGDRFSAGGSVSVSEPVAADLLVAGGSVDVDAKVGGDVLAVGGNVRIKGDVDSGVVAGGGQVLLDARVKRSVRMAGGQVEVGSRAQLSGNLSIAGGHVRIEGPVFGSVQAAGASIVIDAPVGGDVWATGARIALGPNARIGGRLHYASESELKQDPKAIVKGGAERVDLEAGWPQGQKEAHASGSAGGVWIAGLMVLAAVFVAVAPSFTARVSGALMERPWFALLVGFVVLVCVPVAAIVLLVSLIGIPLGLLVLLAYPALLLLGYEMTAIGIGDLLTQRLSAARAQSTAWRAGAAAAAVLLVALLAQVPILGGVVTFLALLAGLGAIVLQWRRAAATA